LSELKQLLHDAIQLMNCAWSVVLGKQAGLSSRPVFLPARGRSGLSAKSMQLPHVDGNRSFGPQLLFETDPISFTQALESFAIYTLVMHEQISSTVGCDETITLVVIEPFYPAFHNGYPFIKNSMQI
jgi:hypothetical protein